MDISNYRVNDPNILLGIVNEKLRLECSDISELSSRYGMSQESLTDRLADIGYFYDPLVNQFRSY
jgi:hypothetical protein